MKYKEGDKVRVRNLERNIYYALSHYSGSIGIIKTVFKNFYSIQFRNGIQCTAKDCEIEDVIDLMPISHDEYVKKIEMQIQYQNWCQSKSGHLDWESPYIEKVYVQWCYKHNRLEFKASYVGKIQGVTYASSIGVIQLFIDKVGEDDFKKYVLGVDNGK